MTEIIIADNGGQYVHRIWRSLRELGTTSKIIPPKDTVSGLESGVYGGIILSGGPTSVYEDDLGLSKKLFDFRLPILGICWGHQFIAQSLGGEVKYGDRGEYGYSEVVVEDEDEVLKGMPKRFQAWVSHRDEVVKLPPDFKALAHSDVCKIEAMRHIGEPIFGVQFHPEVFHTQNGKLILKNFVGVCDG
jgi:GMP synthase (glutamine-hydrolysing)